jgi:hypothetical protein
MLSTRNSAVLKEETSYHTQQQHLQAQLPPSSAAVYQFPQQQSFIQTHYQQLPDPNFLCQPLQMNYHTNHQLMPTSQLTLQKQSSHMSIDVEDHIDVPLRADDQEMVASFETLP